MLRSQELKETTWLDMLDMLEEHVLRKQRSGWRIEDIHKIFHICIQQIYTAEKKRTESSALATEDRNPHKMRIDSES